MRNKEELLESYDIKSWQSIHVNQLSYVRNLFIILSTALTGYIAGLIFYNDAISINIVILLRIAAITFLVPITIGIWIAINESKNFRLKYKASRIVKRDDNNPEENGEFKKIEIDCTCLEKNNRHLFTIQLLTFLAAFIVLTVALF